MSTAAHDYERNRWSHLVTPGELITELDDGDAAGHLLAAVKTGKPELVGAVVLAVFDAYLDRLADFTNETTLEKPVYADDAAMRVLLQASIEQAAVNRAAGMEVRA